MLEICVQSGNWFKEEDPEASLRFIRECGFDCIDYNIDQFLPGSAINKGELTTFFDQSIEELLTYYATLKKAAEENHIKITQMHAPFPLYVSDKEDVNEYLLMVVDKCCAICQYLGCTALVVHPFSHADKEREKEINMQMYRKMIPSGKRYGVTLCLENMFTVYRGHITEGACADVAEVCWYIDTLNAEAGEEVFGYCFDVGHANLLGRNMCAFVKGLGKRLTILHIHDNDGSSDAHLIPYTQKVSGGVNWDGFIEGLIDIGYQGTLSFETFNGIDRLPEEVRVEGLKLVSAIGRSFQKRILAGSEK